MHWCFRRRTRDDDLERELQSHLELEAEEQGDIYAARRSFGNMAQIREDVRQAWGWSALERVRQDLRYALRQMRRTPGYAAVAILTLGLGIGAATAIFSIVNAVLLEPLKFRDPGRLFLARTVPPPRARLSRDFPVNAVQFERWRQYCRACDHMALAQFLQSTLVGAGEPVQLPGLSVSADFFRTLGVQPQLGRDFLSSDNPEKSGWSILITDSLWRSRFSADRSIIGRRVELNGEPHTIIGVMPPDLRLPRGGQWGSLFGPSDAPMVFRPLLPYIFRGRPIGNLNYTALIRLKPGISRERATAELNSLIAGIMRQYQLELTITLVPLQEQVTRNARTPLWLLLASVGVLLLIVCVNVGNLMLVRTSGRYREAGVRLALGSSRGRLFAFVLEEALLLVACGGAVGLGAAWAALRAFVVIAPATLPRVDEVHMDWRVLVFAAAAVVFSTIVCGLIPAWRLSQIEPMTSMKSASAASTETRGKLRIRHAMVAIEVALSAVLLIVGSLLLISFLHVLNVPKGFNVEHVITQDVSFLNPKYAAGGRRRFVEHTVTRLAQLPGVQAASAINQLPLKGDDWVSELEDADQPPRRADESVLVNNRFVAPGYWQALDIPLKQGRYLDESDKNQPHAVISERAARFLWGDRNPIGRRVLGAGSPSPKLEVVGVVGEVRGSGLERSPSMMIYEHYWRMQPIGMSFVVRTRADPRAAAGALRTVLSQADPEMALPPAQTMEQIVEDSVAPRRFQTWLAAVFAAAALLLASFGVYGVISFSVARRRPEIGIRIALGARAASVIGMVLMEGMRPVLAGLAAGIVTALLLGRIVRSQLYGIAANDPATICAVAAVLLIVAVCACWAPARRAARTDAMAALRVD